VEKGLAKDLRNMLLAMATGTGKTKLAIAMLYRLLASKRFRRVCFVVDRNALGKQAAGEFETTRIVSAKTFADIFGLKGLDTAMPDSETKVHICTIQGLVKRVLYTDAPAQVQEQCDGECCGESGERRDPGGFTLDAEEEKKCEDGERGDEGREQQISLEGCVILLPHGIGK
jgi:Type III restriction enzyme, res subunit